MSELWEAHSTRWRHPAQILSHWGGADEVDPRLLRWRATGGWWDLLDELGISLLVTREYEHLVLDLRMAPEGPSLSVWVVPHPSGLAVDHERSHVHVASTRNPNQLFTLAPASTDGERPLLLPLRSRLLPGALYIHDLALVGGRLHANAVGWDRVVRIDDDGRFQTVWWPRSVETDSGVPRRNHLQLNSIAATDDIATSFFSASAEHPGHRRPGHRNFPVDRRGVIFSGATREPCARGLTRPHSARLRNGELWVDNSGYGEVGIIEHGAFTPLLQLPGWTRGLALHGDYAFVGTSRVIPRFRQYAPGLDVSSSVCGVHAIRIPSGEVVGSVTWPSGNQIFAIECLPVTLSSGLPYAVRGGRAGVRNPELFSHFTVDPHIHPA